MSKISTARGRSLVVPGLVIDGVVEHERLAPRAIRAVLAPPTRESRSPGGTTSARWTTSRVFHRTGMCRNSGFWHRAREKHRRRSAAGHVPSARPGRRGRRRFFGQRAICFGKMPLPSRHSE